MNDKFNNIPYAYRIRKNLTPNEAAEVLANATDCFSSFFGTTANAYAELIKEGIDYGEITNAYHDHIKGLLVPTKDLAAWCDRKGISHPFIIEATSTPENTQQADNAALKEAQAHIAQLEVENEVLKARIAELESDTLKPSVMMFLAKTYEYYKKVKTGNKTQERFYYDVVGDDEKLRGLGKTTIENLLADSNKLLAEAKKNK